MNIWKRFLSLALALALIVGLAPVIPFVQANAETETAATMQETVWDFAEDAFPSDWATTDADAYSVANGKLVWSDGGTAANNNSAQAYVNTDEAVALTDYEVSTIVSMVNPGCTKNDYPMTALVVRRADAKNYIRIDVRPTKSGALAPTVRQYVDNAGTDITSTGTKTTVMSATDATESITFKLGAKVAGSNLTVYIDDQVAWEGSISLTTGTAGVISFLTSSTTTVAGQAIEYDDFTITPVVVPATEEVYTSSTKTDMTAKPIYDATFSDGWLEATIELPTLDATTLKNIYDAGISGTVNAQYTIFFTNNKSTSHLAFDILTVRNGSKAGATTTLRLDLTAAGYGTRDYLSFSKSLNAAASAAFWDSTKPVTVKLGKVDNFYTLTVSQNGSEVWTCSFAIDETDATIPLKNPDSVWSFGVSGSIGTLYYDTEKTQQITTPAYISNVSVHRINRMSIIEVADNAASLVTLPTMNVHQGNTVTRTAYYAGETIALTVDPGYDAYANGEKIEDPANFVIPDAETVTITATQQERALYSATYTGGALDSDLWTTGGTVTSSEDGISGSTAMSARYPETFANGYVEVEFAISGDVSNNALVFVRSPNNGTSTGQNDELAVRWTVSGTKATPTMLVRDYTTTEGHYGLTGSNAIHGKTSAVTLTADENGVMTLKVKMEVVGNLLRIYANGVLNLEAAINPDMLVGYQAGYFGAALTADADITIKSMTVQEYKAYAVTLPEGIVADETTHLVNPNSMGATFGRAAYLEGETVTLAVDETLLDASTLAVKTASGTDVTVTDGKFTMPAEAVVVTCDELVMYSITENVDGLSVDKTEAPAGATVTITLDETTLDAATLKVNDGAVAVDGADGTYTFTMPAEAVTITCSEKQLAANETLYTSAGKTGFTTADGWNRNGTFADGSLYRYETLMTEGWITTSITMPAAKLDSYSSNPNWTVYAQLYNADGTTAGTIEVALFLSRNGSTYDYSYIRLGFRDTEYGSGIGTRKDITICSGDNRDNIWGKTITISLRKVGNFVEAKFVCAEMELNETIDCVVSDTMADTAFKFQVQQNSVQCGTINSITLGRINETTTVTVDSDLVSLPVKYQLAANFNNTTVGTRNAYQYGETVALSVDATVDLTTLKANGTVIADPAAFVIPDAETVTITCDTLVLADNQVLYTNNGATAITMEDWSAKVDLTDNKLTGAIETTYNTQIENGWISVTLQMPETHATPTSLQQILIEMISPDLKHDVEFGILNWHNTNGVRLRGYVRQNSTTISSGYEGTTYVNAGPLSDMTALWGKQVTLSMYKIGNAIMVKAVCAEANLDWTQVYTMTTDSALGKEDNFQFGISMPSISGMYITAIEVGRINQTVTLTSGTTLVTIPTVRDMKTTSLYTARTAYMVGETIALTLSDTADAATLKANGTVIADHAAFVIPDAETVTITCDAAALTPYYTNDAEILLHNDPGTAGGTKSWTLSASDYAGTVAGGYIVSTTVTTYTQKLGDGTARTDYPWHGMTVNGIDFRVRPYDLANNKYMVGIRYNNAWVASTTGGVTTSGMTVMDALPGTMQVGADNEVTFNMAVKVQGSTYTLYINGTAVCTYENTEATKGDIKLWAAKNGNITVDGTVTDNGSTWGFTVNHDGLRVDRIIAPENMTFGQKVLALDADMALDFYISTSTTATTATLTLGTTDLGTVTLADAKRAAAIYDVNGDGIAEWSTWYVVTANVPVKDIAKDVTVTLDDSSTYSYSVEKYAQYIVDTDGYTEAAKKTAQSLLDYGSVAASYFANRSGSDALAVELVANANVDAYAPTKTGTNAYISLYGCSLEALEDANICLYFQLVGDHDWDDKNVTVKIGDTVVDREITSIGTSYKKVKITGIHAADLDVVYTVTVASANGDLVISYSGLSYAYTALNYAGASDNLQNLAKALYNYWTAAEAMN